MVMIGPRARIAAAAILTLACTGTAVRADEHRGGDAALGALSGAVVFGPVGAVAGAVVGYTAGPSIARSWGFRHTQASKRPRQPAREARAEVPMPAPRVIRPQEAAAAPAPSPAAAQAASAPPVQTLE